MRPIHKVIINKDTSFNPIWIMRQAGDIYQNLEKLKTKPKFYKFMS